MVYLGIAIAVLMWWYLRHTTQGLRLRSVGENPAAAEAAELAAKSKSVRYSVRRAD